VRGIHTPEGLGDRLRTAAFAERQARDAFHWAAETYADAPAEARDGWRRIGDEEGRHLGMILARMAQLGVTPDERPVSDSLWRSFQDCRTARAFAERMKTAEERGKAAEESFRRRLAESDPVTAALFGRIADDEAEHIALGERLLAVL
jgi:uncharacterized ferritin-like protein (DUF455 family)